MPLIFLDSPSISFKIFSFSFCYCYFNPLTTDLYARGYCEAGRRRRRRERLAALRKEESEEEEEKETKKHWITTEIPSTATSMDRSIMSRASRAMQSACCWQGSGRPLTAMYLSPIVSTFNSIRFNSIRLRLCNCFFFKLLCKCLDSCADRWGRRMSCRARWASEPFYSCAIWKKIK